MMEGLVMFSQVHVPAAGDLVWCEKHNVWCRRTGDKPDQIF